MNRVPETLVGRRSPGLEGVGRVNAGSCWVGEDLGSQIGAIRGGLAATPPSSLAGCLTAPLTPSVPFSKLVLATCVPGPVLPRGLPRPPGQRPPPGSG